MPRIAKDTGNAPDSGLDLSIPEDYCIPCYRKALPQAIFDNTWNGMQHDLDADHPPYQDEDYTCQTCGRKLTDSHDYI